jgi:hypothetical protein
VRSRLRLTQCTIINSLDGYANFRTSPSKVANGGGPTSLIDFDGELGGSQLSTSSQGSNNTGNLLDDLAGLSFNSSPSAFGQGGSISLGQDTSKYLMSPRTYLF